MRTFLLSALILTSASLIICRPLAAASDPKAGQGVYEKHCSTCHGPNGAAPPNVAYFQSGRITDLRSEKVQSRSDAEIAKIVNSGAGKMRGDATVSGQAMTDLVAYLRVMK